MKVHPPFCHSQAPIFDGFDWRAGIFLKIPAGAKGLFPRPGNKNYFYIIILIWFFYGMMQFIKGCKIQCIPYLWAIKGDGKNLIFFSCQNVFKIHGYSLISLSHFIMLGIQVENCGINIYTKPQAIKAKTYTGNKSRITFSGGSFATAAAVYAPTQTGGVINPIPTKTQQRT